MMLPTELFKFTVFKSVMEVSDIDDTTYAFILRSVFSYVKRHYNIDFNSYTTTAVSSGSTAKTIIIPINTTLVNELTVFFGAEITYIEAIVNDTLAGTTTITLNKAFSTIPSSITILNQLITFELQYAIFQHAKFLFESQKKNTSIVDSVTDTSGNKASYKIKLPTTIAATYNEYSPNEVAFV